MEPSPKSRRQWGFHGPLPREGSLADVPVVEFKPAPLQAEPIEHAEPAGGAQVALRIRRLSERSTVPGYQTPGAAGLDVAACLDEGQSIRIGPGKIAIVPTGLALAIPVGFEGQVRPRSGLATKHGVTVVNAPGTIDSDYRGELRIALINLGATEFVVEHGMRIAQLVIAPVERVRIDEVESLDETSRGTGGFGSTGL